MHPQLPLPIAQETGPSLSNFSRGDNGLVVDIIAGLFGSNNNRQVYVWGTAQSGKTHLLAAAHQQWLAAGRRSFYVSLKEETLAAGLLEALDGYDLIALDDVDSVASNSDWERALFNLINFTREGQGKILFSAMSAPSADVWGLADLVSRLSWGPVLKLEALNENDIRTAVLSSAEQRGMKVDAEAVDFLLKRYSRDLNSLLQAMDVLDKESLSAGRERITIPFLKRCFVFD